MPHTRVPLGVGVARQAASEQTDGRERFCHSINYGSYFRFYIDEA
jgi:hypothetical protein